MKGSFRLIWALTACAVVTDSFSLNSPTTDKAATRPRPFLEQVDKILTKLQKPERQLEDHTYLSGNYAPVEGERVRAPVDVVEGEIPPGLRGVFCRNGPNPVLGRPLRKRYHWFDGHAMLHNLMIEDGAAYYTNQFVPSDRYRIEEDLDEEFFPTLGEYDGIYGLAKILLHPDMVRKRIPDLNTVLPPNTNVLMFDKRLYALNEGNIPFEIALQPDGTLRPVGYQTFGLLDYPVSAHPRVDGSKLLFHSYTTNTELIKRDGPMKVGVYDAKTEKLDMYFAPTQEDYVSFAHGLMHTENYMIIWDCNVHFDPRGMFDGGSFFRALPDHSLRFGVIPRNATGPDDVMWIDTGSPAAVVHPLNAWEDDDGTILLWTPRCENLVIDLDTDDVNLFNMVEYRLDPTRGESAMRVIDDSINVEFSTAPQLGKFTRYAYTAIQDSATPGEGSFSGFCRWDMQDRDFRATYYQENEIGGEPMVAQTEDGDTFVGVHLFNLAEEQSYFVLYDGETNELACRLKMPYRVPFGFHGQWLSDEELQGHFEHHGVNV